MGSIERSMSRPISVSPSGSQDASMDMDALWQTIEKMTCGMCHRIPSPKHRYICPDGHLLCFHCGNQQVFNHASTCMVPRNPEANVTNSFAGAGTLPCFIPLCQKKTDQCRSDPIFSAIWNMATWKCPNDCNALVKGTQLKDHLLECKSIPKVTEAWCAIKECLHSPVNYCPHILCHIRRHHKLYEMKVNCSSGLRNKQQPSILFVPQSAIQSKTPYNAVIHCYDYQFMFCMEPSTENEYEVAVWMRLISNAESDPYNHAPSFRCTMRIVNKVSNAHVEFDEEVMPWQKKTASVFAEEKCLKLSRRTVLDRFVRQCEDDVPEAGRLSDSTDSDDLELGFLPVQFSIYALDDSSSSYLSETTDLPNETSSSVEQSEWRLSSSGSESDSDSFDFYENFERMIPPQELRRRLNDLVFENRFEYPVVNGVHENADAVEGAAANENFRDDTETDTDMTEADTESTDVENDYELRGLAMHYARLLEPNHGDDEDAQFLNPEEHEYLLDPSIQNGF